MNNLKEPEVYYLTDDSCEPLDSWSLTIQSMPQSEYIKKYGNTDWCFESKSELTNHLNQLSLF